MKKLLGLWTLIIPMLVGFGQEVEVSDNPLKEGGVIITLILLGILFVLLLVLIFFKVNQYLMIQEKKISYNKAEKLISYLKSIPKEDAKALIKGMMHKKTYKIEKNKLRGNAEPKDVLGLLSVEPPSVPFFRFKKPNQGKIPVEPKLKKLVFAYLISATIWLLFGTTVGEYLGIKFVAPEADSLSWLNFGRLRPVHTNAVFWGWGSLGMLGLAYFCVPRVGNYRLYSYSLGWWTLILINLTVLLGSISLMMGINNGGGEYREYIWPIMGMMIIGVALTLVNFWKTIAMRKAVEIYISNWYIVAALMFFMTIGLVGYLPFWQQGLGETIAQGYYMHQAVGMWFMMLTLGLVYYYLPFALDKPIFSYSLGILAFWSQILFYTLIGTHHFIFSSIPWWLQTVAIFGSIGMIIPVFAGTTNFLMTFKNGWYKLASSYVLPFFLVGIVFYFTGSLQGTAEAFRSANLIWHFTDFTVAHSHMTMYGIITFFLWASMYAIIPRITQKETSKAFVGVHFWLAFIGLLFYIVPLMYGSTLKGYYWMEKLPFVGSLELMAPYWLWRAIGGTLMWFSHFVFAYNLYQMMFGRDKVDVPKSVAQVLQKDEVQTQKSL